MSTGPTGLDGFFKKVRHTSVKIDKKMWCSYKGECKQDLDHNLNLCLYCQYRVFLDIPAMLKRERHD